MELRQTILVSVPESLKLHPAEFNLTSIQVEVKSWWQIGESLLRGLAKKCDLDPPTESRLNNFVPVSTAARLRRPANALRGNGQLRVQLSNATHCRTYSQTVLTRCSETLLL